MWNIGFGAANPSQLNARTSNQRHLSNVLLANLPQLIVSLLYFNYNGVFTCMLMCEEWASFTLRDRPLRVSNPRGPHQRSTYFLQLPYRYALPLMLAMATLYWLISQSLFAVQIAVVDNNSTIIPERQMATCGYSAVALIFVIAVGGLMIVGLLICAF